MRYPKTDVAREVIFPTKFADTSNCEIWRHCQGAGYALHRNAFETAVSPNNQYSSTNNLQQLCIDDAASM
jgi:hypothetical protein